MDWPYKQYMALVICSPHSIKECEAALRELDKEEFDSYYPTEQTLFIKSEDLEEEISIFLPYTYRFNPVMDKDLDWALAQLKLKGIFIQVLYGGDDEWYIFS